MNDEILKRLQDCETNMLSCVDLFCNKHDIKYSLYAGTALGAVRHGGFIPWDDDIDICMERNEYERFVLEWNQDTTIKNLFFQNPEADESLINHAKICKNGTVLASENDIKSPGHHGIWIDIFPLDKVPVQKKKIFLFISKIRLVYTRGYVVKNKGKSMKYISAIMLMIPRKIQIKIRKRCDAYIKKYRNLTKDYCLMSLSSPEALNIEFPANMLSRLHRVQFEKYQFQLTDRYDDMLCLSFGDYMKLPPEDERICKHNPEMILFGDEEIV